MKKSTNILLAISFAVTGTISQTSQAQTISLQDVPTNAPILIAAGGAATPGGFAGGSTSTVGGGGAASSGPVGGSTATGSTSTSGANGTDSASNSATTSGSTTTSSGSAASGSSTITNTVQGSNGQTSQTTVNAPGGTSAFSVPSGTNNGSTTVQQTLPGASSSFAIPGAPASATTVNTTNTAATVQSVPTPAGQFGLGLPLGNGVKRSGVAPGSGFLFGSGGGYFGGSSGTAAAPQQFTPVKTTFTIPGPMTVTQSSRNATPVVLGTRQIFTNGVPTTVSAPLVMEYSWDDGPTGVASSPRQSSTYARVSRRSYDAPVKRTKMHRSYNRILK